MLRISALLLALFLASAATAEELPADPPKEIGRLAALSGAVSYAVDAASPPSDAIANHPLIQGNRIVTRPRAHAAVDIAAGRFYLDGDSAVTIGAIGPGSGAIALARGAVILRILPGGSGQVFTITTPRGTLRADQPGYFEVELSAETGTVVASTLEGGAQFDATVLPPGTRATVAPGAAPVLASATEDDFIRRVAAEVAASGENKLEAPKYVSPQATGFQDLQRYGLWEMTEEYGPVWEPQVTSDWAPFRDGRWVDIKPWGPTWIDNAAWGFTPSHYGRWVQVNRRWAWMPGNAAIAPMAAGLFGTERRSASGWIPLGPEEPVFTPAPAIMNTVRAAKPPEPPKVVNVTTVNNTTNVTTIVKPDPRPAVVLFVPPVPVPPPSPPPSLGGPSANLTGLGAAGTPIQGGVAFPGAKK